MAIDMNALLRSSEEGKKKTDQFLRERYGVATREPEVNLSALIPRPQSAVKPAAAGVNAVNKALLPQRVMEAGKAASQLAGQPKPVNWQTRPYWQPWEENEYNGLAAEQAKLDSAAGRNARLSAQMESLRMDNTLTPEQYKAKLAELEKENRADSADISQIRQNIARLETARELKKKQDELSRLEGVSGRTDFEETAKKGRNSASNPIQAYKTIDFNERADYSLPDYLTDKERAVIDYYTGVGDFSKANEYLLAVSGELSRRAGEDQAKKTLAIENDFLRDFETARLSVNSGLSSGFTGISEMMNRLAGNKTPLDQTAISYAYETVRPELTGAQALISDIGYSVGNMAPSIAVGMINPLAGSVTMGVSSAGNSYAEARRNGYSDDQALAYGILNGVSESAMQYLLGGVGKLGKGGVSTAVSKIPGFSSALTKINNVTSKLALNPKVVNALKTAGKIAADANDEGIEEYLQATIDPIFRNVILGENNEIKAFSEEQLYSYLLGALTSIGMNAATGEYRTVTLPDGRQTQVRVDENGNPVSSPQNAPQAAFSENGITSPANAESAPVNGTEAGRSVIAPVRVGRDTTIKSPYQGATPVNFNSVSKSKPVITKEQVQQARQIVDAANTQHETSFKRYLKDAYQKVIGNRFNGTKVRVKGVTFQDAPYDVTLHKNVIGKVVSDPNFSVEKISVLNQLENVVGNAEYVGSGNFDKTGKRTNNVERYDYFETVVSLPSETGTTDYVVSFDTEIYPYENKFRTYKIKNIDLTPLSEVLAGTAPVANGNNAGLSTPIIPNSSQNSNRVFAPGITSTRENGKTISWSETQKDSVSNPAGAFEEKWGIKTAVVKPDGKTSASAFLKDGTVYLNADKVNTFYGALSKIAHEATHAVENTPAWNEIKKAAAAYYRAVDPNLRPSVMREAVRERYKGVAELTGDQAAAEVVAGFIEDICAQDSMVGERASRILLEKSPNGFKRVTQFLRDKVESLKAYMPVGTGLSRQQRYELQAAQRGLRHLEKALKTYRKGKAEAVQGTKYSIAKDQNGQNLVVVDTDQQLFDGKPKSEYAKIARRIINQRFKGKTLPLSENDLARVTQKSAGEYAYPSTKISSSNYNAKMRASTELDNLLKVSEFLYHANDTKNHPEATLGWDYYKTRFAIDGHFFEGQINIATSENGRVFYDITNIKELPNSSMRVTEMAQSAPTLVGESLLPSAYGMPVTGMAQSASISGEYSNTTIAPNTEGVNNSISKTSKNDPPYSYGEGSFTDYYLDYANRRYGTIPKGERAYREVSVPRRTGEGTKTRRAVRTILEAESTPDSAVEAVKKDLAKEAYAYTPEGDKAALDRAEKTIQTRGFQGALDRWNAAVNGAEPVGKEMMALGETLMAEAGKSGDIELFQKLAAEIAAEATNAGQAVQAVKLIKKFTPEGQLYYVRKAVDGLQKKLDRRMKGKAPELELDPELAKKLLEAKTAEEMETASMDILKSVAEQTPSTWQDKWDAWRYFAMLANPRTHIRNILGNTVFVPARMMKNGAVTLAERAVSPEERTQAFLTKADRPLREFAEQNFETVKDSLTSTGKMNPSTLINELRPVYTSKAFAWLEKLRKLNNRALEAEDLFFLKRAYVSSMAKAMKARGLDADFLQSGTREATKQLRALEKLAAREALEATYRDASSTASALNRFKETNKATDIIGNALFPFTKTPVNVLKRGVEYSPVGLIKGVVDMTYGLKTGKKTAAESVGSLCKGVSGLGIAALGYWLSSMGLLVAGGPEDDRERSFETLQGAKTYALKLGDVYYTIDWMAPVALPLFVGAEMQKAAEGEGFSAANIIDSLTKISEPMFNLSMLDGLNSMFKSISYGSAAPLADFAVNAAKDYITQALPTLGGQIARTIDPTARNSYYVDKNSPIPESVQEFLNAAQAKIPFLSFFLSPKVDQWGRTSGKDNALVRAFENFISPGYISTRNETAVDKEIAKIYKETGETGILPRTADKYFKADGETKRLSAQEYTKYAQERGKRSFEYINQLLSNPGYQKLDPDEKAEVIQQMYRAANAEAKKEVEPDYDIPNTVIKAYEANKQAGILYGDYYLYKMGLESTPNQQEVIDALNSIGSLSKSQKRFLFEQRFPNAKRKPFG